MTPRGVIVGEVGEEQQHAVWGSRRSVAAARPVRSIWVKKPQWPFGAVTGGVGPGRPLDIRWQVGVAAEPARADRRRRVARRGPHGEAHRGSRLVGQLL
jgi:hypothetical protein